VNIDIAVTCAITFRIAENRKRDKKLSLIPLPPAKIGKNKFSPRTTVGPLDAKKPLACGSGFYV
jgi:hypothetical protein